MESQNVNTKSPSLALGLGQALALLVLAVLAGFGFNQLRSKPLPLFADFSPKAQIAAQLGRDLSLSLDEAKDLLAGRKAVFLDAREAEDYALGHIQGAFNVPPLDLAGLREKALSGLPKNTPIVTSCSGEACELSNDLAQDLRAQGYTNVRVLNVGWPAWKAAGLPTELGS